MWLRLTLVFFQTVLWLEVNTSKSKLRDIVDKIVKGKLSINSPIIMQGSCLIYEMGDDLEESMVVQYNINLEKVIVTANLRMHFIGLYQDLGKLICLSLVFPDTRFLSNTHKK